MLLQVQDGVKAMTLRDGLRQMAAEGTVRAYFKGNGANVVKIAPETALKLTMNDKFKRLVAADPENITPFERMMAGGIAGAVAQGSIYPLEMVKTRLAVCKTGAYKGIFYVARKIYREEGYRAFYRGIVPSMIGILPYAGTDIAVFEMFKEHLYITYDGHPPASSILLAGMASSSLAQFVSYPLSLIRTRLQAQGMNGQPLKYTGMMDVITKTIKNEGVRGLYKGLLPNLIKLAPAAGIGWYVFEESKLLLGVDPRS